MWPTAEQSVLIPYWHGQMERSPILTSAEKRGKFEGIHDGVPWPDLGSPERIEVPGGATGYLPTTCSIFLSRKGASVLE
ncbi:hypothetical protein GCM10023166_09240 [Paeniglutamicibacter cryotolerans]|uniref:Uncharacterized protein n=1 Tax=Paeniglutamicibacter cryotolerans TaxID=670079 RepID=A0A839QLU3_9MICC|nr:hypothetical protein [Paeniglutamicibacter cryotolerans]